jgi:hypothetical protein
LEEKKERKRYMTLEKTEAKTARKRRAWKVYSAKEKCRAVLSLWSGRRTPSALCREMAMNWGALHGWEKVALEGMMEALDPGWKKEGAEGIRLGKRIEKLLEKAAIPSAMEQSQAVQNLQ